MRQRRGMASLLAMLYIVLFTTMAIGFYAATTTGNKVVSNELRVNGALLAAESGMDMLRYQLSSVVVPQKTTSDKIVDTILQGLKDQTNGTGNFSHLSIDQSNGVIRIPSDQTQYVPIDSNGGKFQATISVIGSSLNVTVVGMQGTVSVTRTITMQYMLRPTQTQIFNFGVASMGKIKIHGTFDLSTGTYNPDGSAINGSVFSAFKGGDHLAIEIKDKTVIGGDLVAAESNAVFKVDNGCSVGGTTTAAQFPAHEHTGITPPEFPVVDTAAYKPYATNTYVKNQTKPGDSGTYYYSNVVIPANTNPNFDKPTILEGVIYIKMPNKVTFSNNCQVRGIVVVEPSANPLDYANGKNVIDFHNGADLYSMDALPVNNTFPQAMHNLSPATIVAPDSQVTFEGSSTVQCGSLITQDLSFKSKTTGTITGSVVAYGTVDIGGKSGLKMVPPTNALTPWTGLKFTGVYVPDADTYQETHN